MHIVVTETAVTQYLSRFNPAADPVDVYQKLRAAVESGPRCGEVPIGFLVAKRVKSAWRAVVRVEGDPGADNCTYVVHAVIPRDRQHYMTKVEPNLHMAWETARAKRYLRDVEFRLTMQNTYERVYGKVA
jgi:hypothetical protein